MSSNTVTVRPATVADAGTLAPHVGGARHL